MIVGLCQMDLQIPTSQSLKDKRRVVRSIVQRLRNEFNVSVAEVDHLDSWQLSTIAVACVSTSASYAHGLLERVVRHVEKQRLDAILLDYETEFL